MGEPRRRMRLYLAVLASAVVFLSSCMVPLDDGGPPFIADIDADTEVVAIGDTMTNGDIDLVVRNIEVMRRSPDLFPRLRLELSSHNISAADQSNPEVAIYCGNEFGPGAWYLGSTWEVRGFLPEGSKREGELFAAVPAKNSTGEYPVAPCSDPRILIVVGEADIDRAYFEIPLAPEMLSEAAVADVGPRYPLPVGNQ